MSKNTVIKIENVSKMYDLGLVGTGTLSKDLNRAWAKLRGKPDPYATLAELNVRSEKSKSNTVWALKDINLEVEQGEVLGIIGKNGAGKSTLLKILSRITTPTTGVVKMKGRVGSLLEVGTGMHPEMTARQNIFLNGAIMGMTRAEVKQKLDEIVDFAGIGKYIDTPIKRFSSGMKVRLGFAVAAFLEPEILIVDEVLAVGDAEFQKKAIGKMQDINKGEGRTVLFVSHNMAAVKTLCKSGALLKDGIISFIGDINTAIENYRSDLSLGKLTYYNNGEFNLLNRNQNNQMQRMQKVTTYCDGKISNTFHAGCNFSFMVDILEKKNVPDLRFGFVIKTNDGDAIIGINNKHLNCNLNISAGILSKICVEIADFPIYKKGLYSVDLFLGEKNLDYEIIYEAFTLIVEEFDVYKTKNLLSSEHNLLYLKDVCFTIK